MSGGDVMVAVLCVFGLGDWHLPL